MEFSYFSNLPVHSAPLIRSLRLSFFRVGLAVKFLSAFTLNANLRGMSVHIFHATALAPHGIFKSNLQAALRKIYSWE